MKKKHAESKSTGPPSWLMTNAAIHTWMHQTRSQQPKNSLTQSVCATLACLNERRVILWLFAAPLSLSLSILCCFHSHSRSLTPSNAKVFFPSAWTWLRALSRALTQTPSVFACTCMLCVEKMKHATWSKTYWEVQVSWRSTVIRRTSNSDIRLEYETQSQEKSALLSFLACVCVVRVCGLFRFLVFYKSFRTPYYLIYYLHFPYTRTA